MAAPSNVLKMHLKEETAHQSDSVDKSTKIHIDAVAPQSSTFQSRLDHYEQLLKNRYTENDAEYMECVNRSLEPPIITPWRPKENRRNFNNSHYNQRRGNNNYESNYRSGQFNRKLRRQGGSSDDSNYSPRHKFRCDNGGRNRGGRDQ